MQGGPFFDNLFGQTAVVSEDVFHRLLSKVFHIRNFLFFSFFTFQTYFPFYYVNCILSYFFSEYVTLVETHFVSRWSPPLFFILSLSALSLSLFSRSPSLSLSVSVLFLSIYFLALETVSHSHSFSLWVFLSWFLSFFLSFSLSLPPSLSLTGCVIQDIHLEIVQTIFQDVHTVIHLGNQYGFGDIETLRCNITSNQKIKYKLVTSSPSLKLIISICGWW